MRLNFKSYKPRGSSRSKMALQDPERYHFRPTKHVPNSVLPVLIYRAVVGQDMEPSDASKAFRNTLEQNRWMQGGVFKAFQRHHFHSVTHEAYAVVRGSGKMLLGVGPLSASQVDAEVPNNANGTEVALGLGDLIVLPVRKSPRPV